MTALMPRNFGAYPSIQFGSLDPFYNQSYGNGYWPQRSPRFAPRYSPPMLSPPSFFPTGGQPLLIAVPVRKPSLASEILVAYNQLDEQYRYEQYLRNQERMRKRYWREQGNRMPLPMYTQPPGPVFENYGPIVPYRYEPEIRYPTYPSVHFGPVTQSYGSGANFGLGTSSNLTLPPKIRVIFVPTGYPSLQQPSMGPLVGRPHAFARHIKPKTGAMPPFLFNRMAQPLCSLPLPPPLPQIGSLPLSPAVQQMVMERYANPIAVLPFTPNLQMPQMMMPNYVPQQLPMMSAFAQQQPMMPAFAQQQLPMMSAFAPEQQFSMPAIAPQQLPMMPAFAPQQQPMMSTFAPQQQFSTLAYAQQQQQSMMPMTTFPSFPPAPQFSIPPPALLPSIPILSAPPIMESALLGPQYPNINYPSICRACPPAPPPLSIPVTGHCWVQHCCACHQVPISALSNARPAGGRITPLLRHPTVPQYVPDQMYQQQQDPHANAPVMMRPWLRKTPPLPPGAIVISDEYITKDDNGRRHRHHRSRTHRKKLPHDADRGERSNTQSTARTPTNTTSRRSQSGSPQAQNTNNNNSNRSYQGLAKSKSITSVSTLTWSSSTSTGSENVEYHRTILVPQATYQSPQKPNKPKPSSKSRDVQLQYTYQPRESNTVRQVNSYLNSSSEDSIRTPIRRPSLLAKEYSQIPPAPYHFDSKSDKSDENSRHSPSVTSLMTEKFKEKSITIREFVINSPSVLSTISSDASFSIILKDSDSISTTSTLVADKDEDDVLTGEKL